MRKHVPSFSDFLNENLMKHPQLQMQAKEIADSAPGGKAIKHHYLDKAARELAYSMPNHTKYEDMPTDEQIEKAFKYSPILQYHAKIGHKQHIIDRVKEILSGEDQKDLTESFLSEAKQAGIIYHYSTYSNATSIIEQGKLTSSPAGDGTNSNPKYSISFTRDKNFTSTPRVLLSGDPRVRFVIDGDKLSNKHKIEPFAQKGFEKGKKYFEAEERIVEDEPFSVKISNYLIGVDIIKEVKDPGRYEYDFDWDMFGKDQKEFFKLCQSKNIKVNIVDQRGDSIPFEQTKGFFSKLFNR